MFFLIVFILEESGAGFEQQSNTITHTLLIPGRQPAFLEIGLRIGQQARSGVRNIYRPLMDTVHHHEMHLFPIDDAGQRCFLAQLLPCQTDTSRPETEAFRRVTDRQHRHALLGGVAEIPQMGSGVIAAVVLADNPQAS